MISIFMANLMCISSNKLITFRTDRIFIYANDLNSKRNFLATVICCLLISIDA
jgi:hypothetical protein